MAHVVDIQGSESCQRYRTVQEVVFPGIGFRMGPQAEFLFDHVLMTSIPLHEAETHAVYDELRQASIALGKLQQLPEGWDRTNVTHLLSWITQMFKQAVDEKRGIRVHCDGPKILERLEPDLTESTITDEEVQALLHRFGLNKQRTDLKAYLGGRVIAGKPRPNANKLIILLSDTHLSEETQRNILRAVWNLSKDGVKRFALETPPQKITEMFQEEVVQELITKKLVHSLDETVASYERMAMFIKNKMEESPPEWRMYSFYPTIARMMVMAALVGKAELSGVDDDKLLKDTNLTCHADEWAQSININFSVPEREVLWEACFRFGVELRSHLAIRTLVRGSRAANEREVLVLPFGNGHVLSLVGELLQPGYENYSYLVVAPEGVLKPQDDMVRWLERIRNRANRQFQLQPLMQDRSSPRLPSLRPLK